MIGSNATMDIRDEFTKIRDIPYRIPLSSEEEDQCCTGKHKRLFGVLQEAGYKIRWRVCTF